MLQVVPHGVGAVESAALAEANGLERRLFAVLVQQGMNEAELVPGIAGFVHADCCQKLGGPAVQLGVQFLQQLVQL